MLQMQTLFGKQQQMKAVVVQDVPTLLHWWPLFLEGWTELCSPVKGRGDLTASEFLTMLLRVLSLGPNDGLVAVFVSQNDKPLGFAVVMNDSETPERRTALIYAGYSNSKYAHAAVEETEFVQKWAKARGFTELHAQSRRLSGAAMRWFRKKLGFQPMAVMFSKPL